MKINGIKGDANTFPGKELEKKEAFEKKLVIRTDLSPLRYPGGKRKLAPLLFDLTKMIESKVDLFVEPFAGGAAVAIAFLEHGVAKRIALADSDPMIAGFWQTVFSTEAYRLADRIYDTDVTLEEWMRQKSLSPSSAIDLAFQCFFLNRTSFSGSLMKHAGPIGGKSQAGKYKIDCRFNKDRLAERIIELSRLSNSVSFVRRQGYRATFSQVSRTTLAKQQPKRIMWYLDPPFFEKADRLYRHYFSPTDHLELAKRVNSLPGRWILSYDDNPRARGLYQSHDGFALVNLKYSARIDDGARIVASEVLVSNMIAELRASGKLKEKDVKIPIRRSDFQHIIHMPSDIDLREPRRLA